jgi:D-arabinose 5-phosphate isomerase GutQ
VLEEGMAAVMVGDTVEGVMGALVEQDLVLLATGAEVETVMGTK